MKDIWKEVLSGLKEDVRSVCLVFGNYMLGMISCAAFLSGAEWILWVAPFTIILAPALVKWAAKPFQAP